MPTHELASLRIFMQRGNQIVRQAIRIVRIVLENYTLVAVIAIQTLFGAKPHKAHVVLQNCRHCTLRKSLLYGKMCEAHRSSRRKICAWHKTKPATTTNRNSKENGKQHRWRQYSGIDIDFFRDWETFGSSGRLRLHPKSYRTIQVDRTIET